MAAIIKCDGCGAYVEYHKAVHVRTYPMDSATSYRTNSINHADLCPECNKKLCELINKKVK